MKQLWKNALLTLAFCLGMIALSCCMLAVVLPGTVAQPPAWCAALLVFAFLLWCMREERPNPVLPRLQTLLPPGASLYLIDCSGAPAGFQCFDVYFDPAPDEKLVYLNPLLAPLFPTCQIDGTTRVVVPFSDEALHGGTVLVRALAARVWGEQAEAVYHFHLEY